MIIQIGVNLKPRKGKKVPMAKKVRKDRREKTAPTEKTVSMVLQASAENRVRTEKTASMVLQASVENGD